MRKGAGTTRWSPSWEHVYLACIACSMVLSAAWFTATGEFGGPGILLEIFAGGTAGLLIAFALFALALPLVFFPAEIFARRLGVQLSPLFEKYRFVLALAAMAGLAAFYVPRIKVGLETNRLVPAAVHYSKCMEPKERLVNTNDGRWCKDGWRTSSTGSGRCSWHGGADDREMLVKERFQPFSSEKCWEISLTKSWLD